jgi:hypothetical protein
MYFRTPFAEEMLMNLNKSLTFLGVAVLVATMLGVFALGRTTAQSLPADRPKATTAVTPIISAPLISVRVWERPINSSGSNSGGKYEGGRVEFTSVSSSSP